MFAFIQSRRPALWLALAFAGGVLAADHTPPQPLGLFVAAGLALGAMLVGRRLDLPPLGLDILCLLLFALLGAQRYHSTTALLPAHHIRHAPFLDQSVRVGGRIGEAPQGQPDRTRFILDLSQVRTDSLQYPAVGRVLVTVRELPWIADYGDSLVLQGRLLRPWPARNPGAFDYRRFLAHRGIYATLSVRKGEQVIAHQALPGSWFNEYLLLPLRRAIRSGIQSNLTGAPAGLLEGILLGHKHRIPEEVKQDFRLTGLAHALVISGLHVGLLAIFLLTAFNLCRLPPRWAALATVLSLFLYACATDLQAPVVRASLMAAAVLLGRVLERRGDVFNALGLAALLILALWPTSLLTLSFQLSFGATGAIAGLHSTLAGLFPANWRRQDHWANNWLVAPLCASMAAQIGTGPLIAYHFQQLAPIGLAANLVVVPLLALAIALGLLAGLAGSLLPLGAAPFNAVNYLVLKALLGLVDGLADLPGAALSVPKPSLGFLFLCGLITLLIPHLPHYRLARKTALFALVIGLNIWVWQRAWPTRELEITFLDVGQGDAALVRFPHGRTMLVDGGNRSADFDYGARVLRPYLRHRNIDRLDIVVASHPHNDHIGGLVSLLETFEVGHYIDSGQQYDSWTARRLRQLIAEKQIRYHAVQAGDSLAGLDGAGALILHPTRAFVDSTGASPQGLNNGSVAFRLTYGDISLLFTGDIEEETEPALLAWGARLRSQVLKVPHHGSRTSSHRPFIEAVRPDLALVSVGSFNRFGHPDPQVLVRLQEQGSLVYRTDDQGAFILRTDGRISTCATLIPPRAVPCGPPEQKDKAPRD